MTKHLIGILGKKGSGKDTVGNLLARHLPVSIYGTGDEIRKEIATHTGGNIDLITQGKNTDEGRKLQQWWGDMRFEQNNHYWIDKALVFYESCKEERVIVLTSVRRSIEINLIRKAGGTLVRVFRPEVDVSKDTHITECIDNLPWDFSVDNSGSLGLLSWYCKILAKQLKERWGE